MDVSEAIRTRISVRDYTDEPINPGVRDGILDAGRLSQSGHNSQHWRYVVIEDRAELSRVAGLTNSGSWVADAAFGIVLVTDPEYYYHEIDAGRTITHMQLFAWGRGIGSCICTNFDAPGLREHLGVPGDLEITAVIGFGYPPFDVEQLQGRKDRKPLEEVAFDGAFGDPFERAE